MDIYVVEVWSDEVKPSPFDGGRTHDVWAAYYAFTEEEAIEFCKDHDDYNGTVGQQGYFPWHWRIRRKKVGEDSCCEVNSTDDTIAILNPDGSNRSFVSHNHSCKCNDKCKNSCENSGTCKNHKESDDSDNTKDLKAEWIGLDDLKNEEDLDAFGIWRKWFNICSINEVDPVSYQAWDGAIDTIIKFLENEDYDIDIIEKIKTFKTE